MEPSYRRALGSAWSVVWHHKQLWLLGLLSVFLGELGLSNFIGELWAKFVSAENTWWPAEWGMFQIATPAQWFWFIWIVVIVAALLLTIIVAAVCAQAALIYTVQQYYKTRMVPTLGKAWHEAAKHFWPIFAVNILEKLTLGLLLAVSVSVIQVIPTSTAGFIATVILLALSIFMALFVVLTATFALGYVVQNSSTVIEAIGQGWQLLMEHVLVSLELTALLLICNVLVAWAISFGAIIVLIPSFVLSIVGGASGLAVFIKIAVGLNIVLFTSFVVTMGSIFNAFTTTAWMYLFMHMHHEGLTSRLKHFVKKLMPTSA